MFGVSVKLHPSAYVVTHYAPASREERDALVRHPSVWWYLFDDSDDWAWHRGGAWSAQQGGQGQLHDEPQIVGALPGPDAGDWNSPEDAVYDRDQGEDGDDDGRW